MIRLTCKQCGKEFTMADSEIKFYKEKNLQLPKRCKECRDKNKRERAKQSSQYRSAPNSMNNYTSTNQISTKKGAFNWIYVIGLFVVAVMLYVLFDFGVIGNHSGNDSNNAPIVTTETIQPSQDKENKQSYSFRDDSFLQEHYEKHGIEMGYKDAWEYLEAANNVIYNPASLHKLEQEDGDDVYYLEKTNDFVVVSTDGFIRTYFRPEDGIEYYNRQ